MSTHLGTMKDGFFVADDRDRFSKACRAREGKRTTVSVGAITKDRTGQQNRLMWAVYGAASKDLGYTREEMHATFCAMFTSDEDGIVRGTRNMTTIQHIEYLGKVVQKLAEMGCVIPVEMVD